LLNFYFIFARRVGSPFRDVTPDAISRLVCTGVCKETRDARPFIQAAWRTLNLFASRDLYSIYSIYSVNGGIARAPSRARNNLDPPVIPNRVNVLYIRVNGLADDRGAGGLSYFRRSRRMFHRTMGDRSSDNPAANSRWRILISQELILHRFSHVSFH